MSIGVLERIELDIDLLAQEPTSSITAASLIHGYRRMNERPPVSSRCACGGEIAARSGSDGDIAAALGLHYATPEHDTWSSQLARGT